MNRVTESIVPPEGERLVHGWEPDVPVDDTLVRQAALVHASWPVEVARALGRPSHRSDAWAGGKIGDRGALTNPVVLLQPGLDAATLVAEIDELIQPPTPYFLLSPWMVPDMAPHGLELLGHPPLMVRFPAPPPRGATTSSADVREVVTAADLEVAERVLVEGYPMPELQPFSPGGLLAPGVLDGPTRFWVGYVDGRPAAVAAAHPHAGVTLVEYVATLPLARGRGVGSAVTWAATLSSPKAPAVLVASDDGRPVYERMGFVAIERWTAWLRRHDT